MIEGLARGRYRQFHIGFVAFRNMRDHLPVGWIEDFEGLAGRGVEPLSTDQQLALGSEKARRELLSFQ